MCCHVMIASAYCVDVKHICGVKRAAVFFMDFLNVIELTCQFPHVHMNLIHLHHLVVITTHTLDTPCEHMYVSDLSQGKSAYIQVPEHPGV